MSDIVSNTEGVMSCWTDRVPVRVISAGPKTTMVRRVEVRYDDNGYEVPGSRGEMTGGIIVFSLRKDGSWVERGAKMGEGWRFRVGEHGYYDRSF
ncbi:MAG: hypothetical protein ACM3UO_00300 [Bacillota bacterium]